MMNPAVTKTATGYYVNPSAFDELIRNNATMPDIERVIFNLKTEQPKRDAGGKKIKDAAGNVVMEALENPILTTRVNYADGTWTVVQNSKSDKIELVTVMLDADGNATDDPEKKVSEVVDASSSSKEIAITYSVFKRIAGKVLPSGEVVGNGTGRVLNDLVSNAYDSPVQEAKQKIQKAAAKRRFEELKKTQQPKSSKRKSLYETVSKLDEVVNNMQSMFADVLKSKASN